MLANANSGSIYRENRWMMSIGTYFSKDHHVLDIDLESTTCVFRVPKSVAGSNPDAYAPRRLALGPYHHLRPDLCSMQLHKISRVRAFLGPDNLEVFKKVVAALARCEPLVRACYDDFLDFDAMTLATILAVDSLYLLHCFFSAEKVDEIDAEQKNVVAQNAADLLMLENQIPSVLLVLVLKILQLENIVGAGGTSADDLERVLSAEFLRFCRRHSPLELITDVTESSTEQQLHLLDFMYRSIVLSRGDGFDQISMGCGFADNVQIVERAKNIREQLKGAVSASASSGSTLSASELSEIAGVRFEGTPGGIMDITYDVNGRTLQLPRIRIDGNSETVLRNLVAYEESRRGKVNWISDYVDLMCGLICGNEDVVVLKNAGIVVGEVSDEEIFGVFDGLRQSGGGAGGGMRRSSYIAAVGKGDNDVGCCARIAKKGVKVAWQFAIFLASAATLLVLLVQAFCSMFECRNWFQIQSSAAPLPGLRILYSD